MIFVSLVVHEMFVIGDNVTLRVTCDSGGYHVIGVRQICGGDKPYLMPSMLNAEHVRCRAAAMQQFNTTRKMGGDEFSNEFRERLEAEIDEMFDGLSRHNAAKNVFAGLRTPGVLVIVVVGLYLLSGILSTIGLESLANVVNAAMLIVVAILGVWFYSRFTGAYTEIASQIDLVAATVHTFVQPETANIELPSSDKKKKKMQ
jgi:atlastin